MQLTDFLLLNKINAHSATRSATRNHNNTSITSNTIIDHVATDCIHFSFKLSQSSTPLSDHNELLLAVDSHRSNLFLNVNETATISIVNKNEYSTDLQQFLLHENIDSFETLTTGLHEIKRKHTVTTTVLRVLNPCQPWVNNDLLDLIKDRMKYFRINNRQPMNI